MPLKVLFVDDPMWAAAFQREWNAESALPVQTETWTSAELVRVVRGTERPAIDAEVVVFPITRLGLLAERQVLEPLPESIAKDAAIIDALLPPDTFPALRATVPRWGSQTWCVPLVGTPTVLWYRHDLLQRLEQPVPETWDELVALVEVMREALATWRADGVVGDQFRPFLAPLADHMAAQTLLAWAAAAARHPTHYSSLFHFRTMEPLIADPPFVRALEQLQAVMPPEASSHPLDALAVTAQFMQGNVGLALSYPQLPPEIPRTTPASPANAIATQQQGTLPLDAAQIGCARLPGSRDVYNVSTATWDPVGDHQIQRTPFFGAEFQVGGVVATGRRRRVCWVFLSRVMAGPHSVSMLSRAQWSGPICHGQLASATSWFGPWPATTQQTLAELCPQIFAASEPLLAPRIPGSGDYAQALSHAVRQVLQKQQSPQEGLVGVARAWGSVTAQWGRQSQRDAYLRSLGLSP